MQATDFLLDHYTGTESKKNGNENKFFIPKANNTKMNSKPSEVN